MQKILHIDDDKDFLHLFALIYKRWFDIFSTDNFKEFKALLDKENVDLVVTDYEMLGINGLQVSNYVKDNYLDIPVIFLTGQGNEYIAREAFVAGAEDYFTKDFSDFAYKEKIKNSIINAIEKVNIKNKLRIIEETHRLLTQHACVGIATHEIILDENGKPIDYVFLSSNPAFETQTGLKIQDLLGCRVTEVLPGIKETSLIDIYGNVVLTGKPISFEQYIEPLKRHYFINAYPLDDKRFTTVFMDRTEQKNIEGSLLIFKEALENSTDAIGMSTSEGYHYYQNKAFDELFGDIGKYPPHTLYADPKIGEEVFKTLMSGGQWTGEVQMFAKDGRILDIFLRAYANKDENDKIISLVGIHTDITENKINQKALKESHDRLLAIFDSIDEPVYVADMETYEVLYANRVLKDSFGLPGKRKCYEYLQNRQEPCPFCTNNKLLEEYKGRSYVWEFRNEVNHRWYKCIDKAINWTDGRLVRYEMTFDITERKQAEEALQENKELLSATLHSIGDGVIVCNIDSSIVSLNAVAEDLTGWTTVEAVGKPIDEVFKIYNAHTRKKTENPVNRALREGVIVGLANHTLLISKQGKEYQIADSCAPIQDKEGNVKGAVLVFRDVTEEYRRMEELAEERRRLDYILEITNTSINITDANYNLHYTSPSFQKTYGDPTGKKCYEYFMGISSPCPTCAIPKALESKQTIISEQILPKEESCIIEVHTIPFQSSKGEWMIAEFNIDITERKKIEEELQNREKRFRTLFESSRDGYVVANVKNKKFLDANKAFCHMIGWSKEDISNIGIEDIHPEELLPQVYEAFEKQAKGELLLADFPVKRKDGTTFHAEISTSSVIMLGDTPCILGAFRDITDYKHAARTLKELSERQQSLLMTIPDIIMETDTNKVYTWANKAGISFFGKDVIGRKASHYFIGEQDTYEKVEPLFKGNEKMIYVESLQRRRDGEARLLAWRCRLLKDINGQVIGALSTARDITEQKQIEEAMQQQAEHLRLIIDTVPSYIFAKDIDGVFLYANKAVAEVFGVSPEDIPGKTDIDYGATEEQKNEYNKADRKVIESGKPLFIPEEQILRKDGTLGWFQTIKIPYTTNNINKPAILGVAVDITDRKKAEEELLQKNKELLDFAYTVSHDLKNHLILLSGFLKLIEEEPSLFEQYFDKAIMQTNKMFSFIDNLLELSKAGQIAGEPCLIQLENLFKAVYKANKTTEISSKLILHSTGTKFYGDENKLEQLFTNLITNSFRYRDSAKDKVIIEFQCAVKDDGVLMSIKDNGIGIEEKDISRIFDMGFTKNKNYGSGFGLVIVKKIVEAYGGEIWAESKGKGIGTTFNIRLRNK